MKHIECDGCGFLSREEAPTSIKTIAIVIDGQETRREVCASCLLTLKRQADPRQWARPVKERAS